MATKITELAFVSSDLSARKHVKIAKDITSRLTGEKYTAFYDVDFNSILTSKGNAIICTLSFNPCNSHTNTDTHIKITSDNALKLVQDLLFMLSSYTHIDNLSKLDTKDAMFDIYLKSFICNIDKAFQEHGGFTYKYVNVIESIVKICVATTPGDLVSVREDYSDDDTFSSPYSTLLYHTLLKWLPKVK